LSFFNGAVRFCGSLGTDLGFIPVFFNRKVVLNLDLTVLKT